ncbi:MAG: hypothetical protein ACTSYD_08900 [Candidatus Heimdallarchaeaceae archaeon]
MNQLGSKDEVANMDKNDEKKYKTRVDGYQKILRRISNALLLSIVPLILTLLTLIASSAFEGGQGKGNGGQELLPGTLTGFFAFYALVLVMIIGVPIVQIRLVKWFKIKKKNFTQMHCDLAIVTIIVSILHVILLSQTDKWEDYFNFYTIYPKIFLPIEEFFSINLGLTFGVWALLFMFIAGLAGYFRRKIYRSLGRRIFLFTQDLTVIGLIIVVIHADILGRITNKSAFALAMLVAFTAIFGVFWLWNQICDIRKYFLIKKQQKV